MRRFDETELEYWGRRRGEAMALADQADGDLREVHLALAQSYARLIEIADARASEAAGDAAD